MRKQRSLVPRTMESINRQMDPTKDDGGRRGIPAGNICINSKLTNVRLESVRSYNGGRTVLRVWPMLDPEDPGNKLLNGRLSPYDMSGLGGMSISEPAYCASYAGIKRDTLHYGGAGDFVPCSYIIARNKNSVCEGVTFWNEPYVKLYMTVKKAFEGKDFGYGGSYDPRWNSLMSTKMPALGAFRQQYFVVASVYENGPNLDLVREHIAYKQQGKEVTKDTPRNGVPLGEGEKDSLIVVPLSVSAGRNLLKLCCIEKADWTGDETANPAIMYKYGDPTGIYDAKTNTVKGGLFFTIYNPTAETIDKHTSYSGGSSKAAVEYEVAVSTKYVGPSGTIVTDLNSQQVDNILGKHVFLWKENASDPSDSYLLHEPTIEERCVLIARSFRQVPKLLEFGWLSHPEYLNYEAVATILNRKVTSVVTAVEKEDSEDEMPSKPQASVAKTKVIAAKAGVSNSPNLSKSPNGKKTSAELADEFDDEFDEGLGEEKLENKETDDEFDEIPVENAKVGKSKLKSKDDFDDEEIDEDVLDADEDESEEDESEEDGESSDFKANETLTSQLNNSLARAKAVARSRKRSSPEVEEPVVEEMNEIHIPSKKKRSR